MTYRLMQQSRRVIVCSYRPIIFERPPNVSHRKTRRYIRIWRRRAPGRITSKKFIVKNIHWLIENWAQDEIFKAELYREAGDMDEAIKILDNVNATEEFLIEIKNEIVHLAKDGDSSVFVITNL